MMSHEGGERSEEAVGSLKDTNGSDKKRVSNVIHGRKASTYLRIFRDDEGITDGEVVERDVEPRRRKSVSLYDTHYKSSTVPRRKFSRTKEDGTAGNRAKRPEEECNGLKAVSSATYYPHKAKELAESAKLEQGSVEEAVPKLSAGEVPRESTGEDLSEALESDEDEDEEQGAEYPLAVELQPFTNNVGGHTAIFRFSKRAVCKALVNRENEWYENIEIKHKELLQFMPRYIGVLNVRQHFHSREEYLKHLANSKGVKRKKGCDAREKSECVDVDGNFGCRLKQVHTCPCDSEYLEASHQRPALSEVVLDDNRHMIPGFMQNWYPQSPSSAPSDSFLYSHQGSRRSLPCDSNDNRVNLSGSTTVNTKLKELVLQEVFAPTYSSCSRPRRLSKKDRASSHGSSRRNSNQSLRNLPTHASNSPLLKKTAKESISNAISSPNSVMDLKQLERKEIARENARSSAHESPRCSTKSSPLLQPNEAISPLFLPVDRMTNEGGVFEMDDDIEDPELKRNRLPEADISSAQDKKNEDSVTFEDQSIVSKFILLEDLTRKLNKPCALDLKMGTRQYGVDATRSKQLSQREKCRKTTSRKLGVRVCGLKIWNQTYYITRDKYFGRRVKIGWQFTRVLARFIYDGRRIASIIMQIPRLIRQLDTLAVEISALKGYRLYGSSLLLMYDGQNPGNKRCRVKVNLIDFARCVTKDSLTQGYESFRIPPKNPEIEDRGFLRGVRSLRFYLMSIWNYLTGDVPLSNNDDELTRFLEEHKEKFDANWEWLDQLDKENEEDFNNPNSELRTKWRKYELIFDLEPRYSDEADVSD
ncbi:hypothetical protein HG536_0G03390 [Torulaspora globosa]|uniref:Kinase n=1 Tax=Torulaspora globosa TaxID=48254 RepID=A0A7G3ZLU1_9SACH|nr:uncharacterized protein HG536_0G03390 [Torulaspora globosa]QLL34477.1 hypothetical protein HG536_0G03390 [Torulaspora globosa]